MGELPKACPRCGTVFLGNRCPKCGWEVLPTTPTSPKKKMGTE